LCPNYLDEQMLKTLHLLEDLHTLLGRLDWLHFVTLQESVYEWIDWEFMSSFLVDLRRTFREDIGYIRFQFFN